MRALRAVSSRAPRPELQARTVRLRVLGSGSCGFLRAAGRDNARLAPTASRRFRRASVGEVARYKARKPPTLGRAPFPARWDALHLVSVLHPSAARPGTPGSCA